MSLQSVLKGGASLTGKILRSRLGRLGLAGMGGLGVASLTLPVVVRRMDRRRPGGWEGETATPPGLEMKAVSADGTPIHLVVHGEGDKVVFFVHGWDCNNTIYRHQQRYFQKGYKVVSLDLRGFGRSGIPSGLEYDVDRLAEDLKAVVDLIDPGRFVVAGHSMGGFTAFRFFARFSREYRGRLKGLVIIDSSGMPLEQGVVLGGLMRMVYPFPLDFMLKTVARFGRLIDPFMQAFKNTSFVYLGARVLAFGKKPAGDEVELVREMVMSTPATSFFMGAKTCMDCYNADILPDIDVPVLILMGGRDLLTNVEVNEKTAALIPDARLVIYPDAGHCALLENHEEFNGELADFFEQVMA